MYKEDSVTFVDVFFLIYVWDLVWDLVVAYLH